jgi:dihydrofolate reductase
MKRTIHIAISLDGFIADAQNGIHWLETLSDNPAIFSRIIPFMEAVDGVVMGRKTYDQALELGEWSYSGKPCLVVTSSIDRKPTTPDTYFIHREDVMEKATALGIQNLWVIGGGMLNGYMVSQGWVDELIVTVTPIVLGQGQGLMPTLEQHKRLKLLEVHPLVDGFVELSYTFAD